MSKLQISKKFIVENFELCKFSGAEAQFYKDEDKIYKLYKYKSPRLSQLNILENNKIHNAINIEDLIYEDDKLIGSTTIYDSAWTSLSQILKQKNLEISAKKEIFVEILNFTNELIKNNLCYVDFHLSNVGLSNGDLKFLDLDGSWYCADDMKKINLSFSNMYRLIISMILNLNEVLNITYVKNIYLDELNRETITNFVNEYNKEIDDIINEKHNAYQLNKKKLQM